VGVVTMAQLMVDCGDDPVEVGDEVVLLGRQGDEAVRPEEWATLTGTIGYEIVCAISDRISRRYV
jgi:alanine racemase